MSPINQSAQVSQLGWLHLHNVMLVVLTQQIWLIAKPIPKNVAIYMNINLPFNFVPYACSILLCILW